MRNFVSFRSMTRVVICALALGIQNFSMAQSVESTGFEADAADGGWEASYSICGSGGLSPNPNSGWTSTLCAQPNVATANPKLGAQHLRFFSDPSIVSPRCGYLECPNQIATPPQGPQPITPTRISFDIASSVGSTCGDFTDIFDSDLFLVATAASEEEPFTAGLRFSRSAVAFVATGVPGEEVGLWFLSGYFDYDKMEIELDPCANTQTYRFTSDYDGAVHELVQDFAGKSLTVEQVVFSHDNFGCIWDIDNLVIERGEPCELGVCCDRTPGRVAVCEERIIPDDCVGEFDVWSDSRYCSDVICSEVTGACCDSSSGAGGSCLDDVLLGDCSSEFQQWNASALCSELVCEEVTGTCCDRTPGNGTCADGSIAGECVGPNEVWTINKTCANISCEELDGACCNTLSGNCFVSTVGGCPGIDATWTVGATCSDISCDPALGACCDTGSNDPTLATCVTATLADCGCSKCTWTRDADCENVLCDANFQVIPTVSEWGLLVLALILLVVAKVHSYGKLSESER